MIHRQERFIMSNCEFTSAWFQTDLGWFIYIVPGARFLSLHLLRGLTVASHVTLGVHIRITFEAIVRTPLGEYFITNLIFTANDSDATCTIYSWLSTPRNVDNAVDESIINNIDSITEPLEINNPSSAGHVYKKDPAFVIVLTAHLEGFQLAANGNE